MSEFNQYAASTAPLEGALPLLDITSAGKWRRFFNYLIDYVAVIGCGMVLGVVLALVGGDAAIAWLETMEKPMELLLGLVMFVGYYTLLEGMFGFTVGKLITDTRVVDEYGRPPGFRRAFLRLLCRCIPLEPFSLLFSDDAVRRGWHDSLPRTHVINRPRGGSPAGTPRRSIHAAFADGVLPEAKAPPPTVA